MSGWGGNEEQTSKLKLSSLIVTTTEECHKQFERVSIYKISEDYHICAAKKLSNSTACHGDSGGMIFKIIWINDSK